MKISWRMIAYGFAALLVFLVATLPADIVLPRLQSRGISAAGVAGSIWKGNAATLQIGNTVFGATQWDVNVLRLFTAKLSADIRVKRDEGSAQAQVTTGFGNRTTLSNLQGTLPIASLGGLGLPGGWQGNVRINIATLEMENKWPIRIVGSIDALNLVGPAYQPTALGNFRVGFVDRKLTAAQAVSEGITGTLASEGEGPLDVQGSLQLFPNRTYVINAQVATRPSAPPGIAKALQYLGPPDAQGRRPLSISGSL